MTETFTTRKMNLHRMHAAVELLDLAAAKVVDDTEGRYGVQPLMINQDWPGLLISGES